MPLIPYRTLPFVLLAGMLLAACGPKETFTVEATWPGAVEEESSEEAAEAMVDAATPPAESLELIGACTLLTAEELEAAIGPPSLAPALSGDQVEELSPGESQYCSFSADPNSVTLTITRYENPEEARDIYNALASADDYETLDDLEDAAMWREVSSMSGAVTILYGMDVIDMWVWMDDGTTRDVALNLAAVLVERLPQR